MLEVTGDLDERFAGDAADSQADAADPAWPVTVDQDHVAAELCAAQRGGIAAGTSADDNEVG